MHIIRCPYCGERDEHEFHYGGEGHIARPLDPDTLSDEEGRLRFQTQESKGLAL